MSPGLEKSHRSVFLRRLAALGAQRAPKWFVRGAPPLLGVFFAFCLSRTRAQVRANLLRITPNETPLRLTRDVLLTFVCFAQALTESLGRDRFGSSERFRVRGRSLVEPLLEKGGGMIFLTAHVGPWDAAAMVFRGKEERELMMLMGAQDDARAAGFQDQLRSRARISVVRLGGNPLDALPALSHLAKGGILVAQVDRVPQGSRSISADLFGVPFALPRGIFQLAGLARVPLVPIFAARLGFCRNLVEVCPPLFVSRRPGEAELGSVASSVLSNLERHLSAFPTQWFHFPSSPMTE